MVSPSASDCSTALLSLSVNVQPTEAVLVVSVVFSLTAASAKVPMLVVLSVRPGRGALDVDDFSTNEGVWASIGSRSWNAPAPDVPILPAPTLVSSVTPPAAVVEPAT